jgi:hypothetical protein
MLVPFCANEWTSMLFLFSFSQHASQTKECRCYNEQDDGVDISEVQVLMCNQSVPYDYFYLALVQMSDDREYLRMTETRGRTRECVQ